MDATPRLRGAFPSTPQTDRRRPPPPRFAANPSDTKPGSKPVPQISPLKAAASQPPSDPLIPERVLDAPTQRLFAFSFWVFLQTWKIYDYFTLAEIEEQSLWLFMKWLAIDGVFLFGLPSMRIPWLEWSPNTISFLFLGHAFLNAMLMFRIPVPLGAGLAAIGRSFWGAYELAISEHSVNPQMLKFNDSLILGRQIIHILPEGSAILNPDRQRFCLDSSRLEARLPIKINSTNPIAMELLRVDLDNDLNETIPISKSQIKTMHKEASRMITYSEKPNEPKTLFYSVKKPGLYVLQKVVDESNLEVSRKQLAHTVVVPCPKAALLPSTPNRCKGEVSDIDLEVVGTPPLSVKYRKNVDKSTVDATFDNIVPENFVSPLATRDRKSLVVPKRIDTSWAKSQAIHVPLSESLHVTGSWVYSIESVSDGFGNTVNYSAKDHDAQEKHLAKASHLHQIITVHERPAVSFKGCSPQNPLKAPKGKAMRPPLEYSSTGHRPLANTEYHIEFAYSPDIESEAPGDAVASRKQISMTSTNLQSLRDPGLYTITGVRTDFCQGEVLEPASCLLQNPPQPQVSIEKHEISDRCAGSPIGLRVEFDLIGTPPFLLKYRVTRAGLNFIEDLKIDGLRGETVLEPPEAGYYTYEFIEISDAVYRQQPLRNLVLEQDVKPSANARFINTEQRRTTCIDDTASFDVRLSGEAPFTLEYELIHGGKRKKYSKEKVESDRVHLQTERLTEGGEYILALTSITDRLKCKEFLKDEAKISVHHEKPRVGFGHIDGRRSVTTLEGSKVELPLRLGGQPPWSIKYADKNGQEHKVEAKHQNDRITVKQDGMYRLLEVHDRDCPGVVDDPAKTFEIGWEARPDLRIRPSDRTDHANDIFTRAAVCEGDEDAVEVLFKGTGPFEAQYVQHVQLDRGTVQPKPKILRSASNMTPLLMDTSQAGLYEYKLNSLKDVNYDPSSKHFTPLTIKQRVNPRPSAAFANPGKVYSYCSKQSEGEEVIPVTLHGQPPFDLEVEIRHHNSARAETVSLNGISSTKHNIRIPHSRVQTGKSTISLRRVSDSRGCARTLDSSTPRVQIAVHDAPTISPLESYDDFCVGDRLSYSLSGTAPFTISYTFEGAARQATASTSTFRRLAEKPGEFVITDIQDSASACRSSTHIARQIHGLPSARVSKGRETYVDIHEGGTAEILFEFGGLPPFEFTYIRTSNTARGVTKPGTVLDMKGEVSEEYSMRIMAHEEGTYEVISIQDRFCSYAKPGVKLSGNEGQKKLQFYQS